MYNITIYRADDLVTMDSTEVGVPMEYEKNIVRVNKEGKNCLELFTIVEGKEHIALAIPWVNINKISFKESIANA